MAGKRFQFSLRSLMIAVTLLAVVVGLLSFLIQKRNELFHRQAVYGNLRQLIAGIESYQNCQGHPLARDYRNRHGKPLSSWRFQVTHYVLEPYWFNVNYKLPWNNPANAVLSKGPNPIFCFAFYNADETKHCMTNVFAITGPDTAFDDRRPQKLENLPRELIVLAEVRDSGVHWMAPGDFDVRTMPAVCGDPQGKGISGTLPGGFFVAFADGEAWFLSNDTPFAELKKFFTIDECKKHSREKCLGPYRL